MSQNTIPENVNRPRYEKVVSGHNTPSYLNSRLQPIDQFQFERSLFYDDNISDYRTPVSKFKINKIKKQNKIDGL